jgi:hypothetical protein
MLRGVCLTLTARGHHVTVIGRQPGRLRALQEAARHLGGAIYPLPLGYRNTAALTGGLEGQRHRHGPITLAVCWIHRTAPQAPLAVAEALDGQGVEVRYFRLLGSASDAPGGTEEHHARDRFARLRRLRYREILLGYARDDGASRWLSDEEICAGVISAIDDDAPRAVVGTIEPWDLRPR